MKNYRLQDGCWNCKYAQGIPYCGDCCYCTKSAKPGAQITSDCLTDYFSYESIQEYGICDLYEKDDA
jgi:hypothetical protein